jgi:hypothetical protein
VTDLVEFLRARLDEDEQAAKRVRQPYRLYVDSDGRISEPKRVDDLYGERDGEYELWADGEDRMPNHIASWSLIYDPARVLREVEVKRRIVELHQPDMKLPDDWYGNDAKCKECGQLWHWIRESPLPSISRGCRTIRRLAAPFSGEPGYKEEWKP